MLKETRTYIDYDGNERTEDFYFNLSKAELLTLECSKNGGLEKHIQKIIKEVNGKEIMDLFTEILHKAYGEKSLDGKRFIKNKELTEAFTQTEAYADLFYELCTDGEKAGKFIRGLLPKELVEQAEKEQQKAQLASVN